jgi:hypothetical protein
LAPDIRSAVKDGLRGFASALRAMATKPVAGSETLQ